MAVQNSHRSRVAARFIHFMEESLDNNAAYEDLPPETRDKIAEAFMATSFPSGCATNTGPS